MNRFEKVFVAIGKGVKWVGVEIEKGFTELPKLIKLADDVKEDVPVIIPEVTTLVADAGALATATVKDSGTFISATAALGVAIEQAVAAKALDIVADESVATAFENLVKAFEGENVADILTAWNKLVTDAQKLSTSTSAALKQLEADATATASS
jgi:hypothetical protein